MIIAPDAAHGGPKMRFHVNRKRIKLRVVSELLIAVLALQGHSKSFTLAQIEILYMISY